MTKNKEIRKVTIVGAGAIGASWAALYLARGFNVVATDPAPNAEANLHRFIDAAWIDLKVLGTWTALGRNGTQSAVFTSVVVKAAENWGFATLGPMMRQTQIGCSRD